MARQSVCEFDEGRADTQDASRSGRLSEAVNEDSPSAVSAILERDCSITQEVILHELDEVHFIDISRSSFHNILNEELGMIKLTARYALGS